MKPLHLGLINNCGIVYRDLCDACRARIDEFSLNGKAYVLKGTFGKEQVKSPWGIAVGADGNVYVSDSATSRIYEYSTVGKFLRSFGSEGSGSGQLRGPKGITTDSAGDLWVADSGNNRISEFGPTGAFIATLGTQGSAEAQLKEPAGVATDAEEGVWAADTVNSRIEQWAPTWNNEGPPETGTAHDEQTIYYGAAANTKYPTCGGHPEWAGLICRSQPTAQPEGTLPSLPVTTINSYNVWDEPLTTTSTSSPPSLA